MLLTGWVISASVYILDKEVKNATEWGTLDGILVNVVLKSCVL